MGYFNTFYWLTEWHILLGTGSEFVFQWDKIVHVLKFVAIYTGLGCTC